MSKSREKTTGVPAPSKRKEGRTYLSRAEREARANRIILIVTGAIAGLVLVILAVAVLNDAVIMPSQPVASAGGSSISAGDFARRVRFDRWRIGLELGPVARSQFAQQFLTNDQFGPYAGMYRSLQIPSLLGQQVLSDMLDELVIRQYAAENNITVSAEEIEQEVFRFFGYQPTPMTETPTHTPTLTLTPLVSPTPTPTQTPTVEPTITATPSPTPFPTGIPTATPGPTEQFENFQTLSRDYYAEAARVTGYSEAEIRQILADRLLRDKVRRAVVGDPPTEQEQIRARHILVRTLSEAQDVLAALEQGEPFAALARAVSQDQGSRDQGGELGWNSEGVYVPEFEEAIWNARVGELLGPIDTTRHGANFGYHIIQVEAREMRPLTPDQAETVIEQAFTDWLNEQREQRNAQTFAIWRDFVPTTPTLTELGLPERL
jgi:parvulin-like peptidyl-prolyl isomerase